MWRVACIRVAKIKALISFEVTAKLICVFVFAYADCLVSCAAAQVNVSFSFKYDGIISIEMF